MYACGATARSEGDGADPHDLIQDLVLHKAIFDALRVVPRDPDWTDGGRWCVLHCLCHLDERGGRLLGDGVDTFTGSEPVGGDRGFFRDGTTAENKCCRKG